LSDNRDDEDDFLYRPQRARGERLDPAIKTLALGAGGVALAVILLALAYSGARPSAFGPPPVIAAPDTPLRVVPSDPGGMQVAGADMPILSGQITASSTPQLAPGATAPDVAQLDQAAGVNQPPPAPAPAPTPVPAAAPAPAAPAKPAMVQLAATAGEPGAEAAWTALMQKFPDLFKGRDPIILPDVVNGQSVWRLRLGGFASADDATAFCAKLSGAPCEVLP
jgi:hypothetical protein